MPTHSPPQKNKNYPGVLIVPPPLNVQNTITGRIGSGISINCGACFNRGIDGKLLWIEDLNGKVSVTNAIEEVIKFIMGELSDNIIQDFLIIYKDSQGRWDGVTVYEDGNIAFYNLGVDCLPGTSISDVKEVLYGRFRRITDAMRAEGYPEDWYSYTANQRLQFNWAQQQSRMNKPVSISMNYIRP